jgi:GT2 family glycosyltransferase
MVTYNSAAAVGAALDSLGARRQGLELDVVVVDNGSTDATAQVVAARDDCRLVRSDNRGYAAGVNLGVASGSHTAHILVLNPDTECLPGSIAALLHASREEHAIVAPRILEVSGMTSRSLRRAPSLRRALGLSFTGRPSLSEIVGEDAAYETRGRADWATGAALMVPRECHDSLGGWDESFFLYSEETDFCLRAADEGWPTVYEPSAAVRHAGRGSGWNDDLYAMQIVNRVRLFRRRRGPVSGATYFALTALREASHAVLRRDRTASHAMWALLRPSRRPAVLHCADRLVPR